MWVGGWGELCPGGDGCCGWQGGGSCVREVTGVVGGRVGAGGLQGGLYPPSDANRRIWLDEVACTGAESHLGQCPKSAWGSNDCSHREDAAVLCESGKDHRHLTPL